MSGPLRYISVCSGIEAASVAWHPLGWRAAALSEIEKFPSAVLAHHYPDAPNLGDMTQFHDWPELGRIDLLVGGTPCQSFSVAGLRKGLADPRGNLALTYLALVDKYRPAWVVWENVPGVLSSNQGRDFGSFLGGLAELGYGWAYRSLDAQFFHLAQRRERVFVVGSLAGWRRAAEVLFEPACLSGDSPPRRETGEGVTAGTLRRTDGGSDVDHARAGHLIAPPPTGNPYGDHESREGLLIMSHDPACTLTAREYKGPLPEADLSTVVAHTLRSGSTSPAAHGKQNGTDRETLIPIDMRQASRGAKMTNNRREGTSGGAPGTGIGEAGDPSPTIAASHIPAVAFRHFTGPTDTGAPQFDRAPTLRGNDTSGLCVAFDTTQITSPGNYSRPEPGAPCHPLARGAHAPAVAFQTRIARNGRGQPEEICPSLSGANAGATSDMRPCVAGAVGVRRLTPTECARLQGFPDDYLDITFNGKPACDGPKYRALGNSMAVPVMRWIGGRINKLNNISNAAA